MELQSSLHTPRHSRSQIGSISRPAFHALNILRTIYSLHVHRPRNHQSHQLHNNFLPSRKVNPYIYICQGFIHAVKEFCHFL
jgi:hypothetical protein